MLFIKPRYCSHVWMFGMFYFRYDNLLKMFIFSLLVLGILTLFCCLCRLHNSEHGDIRSILSNGQVFSGLLVNGTFSKRYMHLFFFSCSYNFALATLCFDGFLKVSNARAVATIIALLLCHSHFLFSLLVTPSIINCHCQAWSEPITACVAFTTLCNSLYKDVQYWEFRLSFIVLYSCMLIWMTQHLFCY